MNTPPNNALSSLHRASIAAARMRSEWMMSIHDGVLTSMDLISEAAAPHGRPLRRIRLLQLLAAAPQGGLSKAGKSLNLLRLRLGDTTTAQKTMTVGWLIDARSTGVRFKAWLDAIESSRTQPPWPGYPFTLRPTILTTGQGQPDA